MHLRHHHATHLQTTDRTRREGGFVMAMFGLLLVPLLLMAGLAIDVGSWYSRASDIQRAADAAALAGVVWLPNETKARQVALDVAARNGFVHGQDDIRILVSPSTKAPRRLNVTIHDDRVGSFFYSNVGGDDINLTRQSYAEYVTPVPMGSPRNFFGLGTLPGTGFDTEYLYQSVNPYCTDKVNGDRYQSRSSGGTCNGNTNSEYRDFGYEMYIEAPAGRSSGIEVLLYDPRYNESGYDYQVPGPDSCTTADYIYPTSTTTGWTGPVAGNTTSLTIQGPVQYQTSNAGGTWSAIATLGDGATTSFRRDRLRYRSPAYTWPTSTTTGWTNAGPNGNTVTINGLVQYQTRPSTSGTWTTAPTVLDVGQTFARAGNLLRYRRPTYTLSTPVCTPTTVTQTEAAVDDKRLAGDDAYTYTLYAADTTPLDDSDNPQICTATYSANTAFTSSTDPTLAPFLSSRRWNRLCTIATTGPSGKYILRVRNQGSQSTPLNDGSNQWGLIARYTNAPGTGLCDGRVTANCPRVYGKDAISVRAAATTPVASFYLAEIGPEHAGKKLKLDLFDPGEGGTNIQIQRPTGTNSWTAVPLTWTSVGASPASGSGTSIDVTNSRFNGRLLEITVDLTGYNPPSDNNWWKIQYTFSGAVTDRTTWNARIVGDPVHLIEEN